MSRIVEKYSNTSTQREGYCAMWQTHPLVPASQRCHFTMAFTALAFTCSTNLAPEPLLLARTARHILRRAILCAFVLGSRCSRRSFNMPAR